MRTPATVFALVLGVPALALSAAPAWAEMFTCHDRPGQLLYSYNGPPSAYRSHASTGFRSRATSDYAARTRYRAGQPRGYSTVRYWDGRTRW